MKKIRNSKCLYIIMLLAASLFFSQPVFARSTSDATEVMDDSRTDMSLTLTYTHADGSSSQAFAGENVKLYQIASVDAKLTYKLTSQFAGSGIDFSKLNSQKEWDTATTTLLSYITANQRSPLKSATTDNGGIVTFQGLKPGIYLATGLKLTKGQDEYTFKDTLTAVPGVGDDGKWQYQVSVKPKSEKVTHASSKTTYQVTKLWSGDDPAHRPQSVKAAIYCNDEIYKTVMLSADNNWTYKWRAGKDNRWTVTEETVPEGYQMKVSEDNKKFTITNTATDTSKQVKTPKTGDDSQLSMWIALMSLSGMLLILIGGWLLKKGKR